MVTQELLNAAKIRLRKTTSNVLDEDIKQLLEVAIRDLERIGVADIYLSACDDPLIREAILTFANANYGSNPDRDKLMNAYDMFLTKIKGGGYSG
ncbi:MAG: hypothetical protein LUH18_03055 [Oscillospiraceae bacterium]|nr:hypothetical protein [Oscillospiraceae bacterium]